ncbi:MAG: hypothetical protein ACJA01_002684 [Saprospiraceae bacterium]
MKFLFEPEINIPATWKTKRGSFNLSRKRRKRILGKRRVILARGIVARLNGNVFLSELKTTSVIFNKEKDLLINHIKRKLPELNRKTKKTPIDSSTIMMMDILRESGQILNKKNKYSGIKTSEDGSIISLHISLPDYNLTKIVAETFSTKILQAYARQNLEVKVKEYGKKVNELKLKFEERRIGYFRLFDQRRNIYSGVDKVRIKSENRKIIALYSELNMYEELYRHNVKEDK